ncbi:transmembrane protein 154 [Carettochelys insculpta]|uniref:transmembrane protein 154 n=1 Tax=Carettochelys insculpta TaxID=44489 RepID=UPI003EBBF583
MSNQKKHHLQTQNFMLVFVLFFIARSVSYGSETEDTSGAGALVTVSTSRPERSAEYFTTAGDHDLKPAITPTGTEINSETEYNTSIELDHMNGDGASYGEGVQATLMFGIPVVIIVLLILLIIFFVIHHTRKKSKQGELGSENVKSPIFEEDTPSVMEIEMEELDKWMNSMNKNAECECLPTVKEEEKESNVFTSDCES